MTIRNTTAMIARMTPVLTDGAWVYCCEPDRAKAAARSGDAFAVMREDEGVTLILPVAKADAYGYNTALVMTRITLGVFSSLEGVGLTAAVAQALTDADISCNMVAAFHHDHVFVPAKDAPKAMETLLAAQHAAR